MTTQICKTIFLTSNTLHFRKRAHTQFWCISSGGSQLRVYFFVNCSDNFADFTHTTCFKRSRSDVKQHCSSKPMRSSSSIQLTFRWCWNLPNQTGNGRRNLLIGFWIQAVFQQAKLRTSNAIVWHRVRDNDWSVSQIYVFL